MVPAPASAVSAWRFGPFRLSVADRILEQNGERVLLTPKVIDTLFVLVENRHQVVTKDALMKAIWPEVNVVESGLTRNISTLRKALEREGSEGSYIETIPRRGYRFVAEVHCEYRTVASPVLDSPPVPSEVAPPRRRLWLVAALVLFLLAVWVFRPKTSVPGVDPHVRIGEHLLYKLAPEETVKAAESFAQAVASEPRSAAAHAGLSIALVQQSGLGVSELSDVAERAERAARRALELDPQLAVAHYAVASIDLVRHLSFDAAEKGFRRALELDPTSVQSRYGYSQVKITRGDLRAAISLMEEALRLDPASPLLGARYCQTLYYAREFHRAEAECRKVLDRESGYALAHYYLALSLGCMGRTEEARQALQKTSLMPPVLEVDQAWLSLLDGDRTPATKALTARRDLIRRGNLNASATLLLATILGEKEEAYTAVQSAIQTKAVELLSMGVDPRLTPLREDERIRSLLQKIGL